MNAIRGIDHHFHLFPNALWTKERERECGWKVSEGKSWTPPKRIYYLFFGFFSLRRDQPNAIHEFFAVVAQLAVVGRAVEARFAAQRNGGLQLAVVHTVVPVGEKGRCGGW